MSETNDEFEDRLEAVSAQYVLRGMERDAAAALADARAAEIASLKRQLADCLAATPVPPVITPPVTGNPVPPTNPPTGSKPNAATTGPRLATLKRYSGPAEITTPGLVLDGYEFTYPLYAKAPGIKVTNFRTQGDGTYAFQTVDKTPGGFILEDGEVIGYENGFGFNNIVARRLNVHGQKGGDGVKLGSKSTVEDCWIHDLAATAKDHADGMQMQSGTTDLIVRRNNIDLKSSPYINSPLFICPDQGNGSGPVLIEGNWISGGNVGIAIYDGSNGKYLQQKVSVLNNIFKKGSFAVAPLSSRGKPQRDLVTASGNKYEDGTPVPLGS